MPGNQLFYGDNLDVLRHSIKDASVDIIYLVGCPILSHLLGKGGNNSRQDYNVLFAENSDMTADLAMMAPRLIELKRVLKETGSIYLHCDPTPTGIAHPPTFVILSGALA